MYLCKYYGLDEVAEYWHQVVKINNYQKNRFAQKIIDYFGGDLNGKKIAILGWAFKANTNDSRESASIYVTETLTKNGAFIGIYDPMVSKKSIFNDISNYWLKPETLNIKIIEKLEQSANYDAILILTEWEEFKNKLDADEFKGKIFDGRKLLDKKHTLYSIGS